MRSYISPSYRSMLITQLLSLLEDSIRDRIRRGHDTERSLARRAGISQPHLHNILKGRRAMSPRAADALMRELGLSVTALISKSSPPRDTSREPDSPSAPN